MDGFNCLKARATSRRQFTFYHQVPRKSWHSFDRPRKNERLSRPCSHPVVLNTGPLDTIISKFLPLYHVIISNVHVCSLCAQVPTCTDVHLKRLCVHKISCTKNYNWWSWIVGVLYAIAVQCDAWHVNYTYVNKIGPSIEPRVTPYLAVRRYE